MRSVMVVSVSWVKQKLQSESWAKNYFNYRGSRQSTANSIFWPLMVEILKRESQATFSHVTKPGYKAKLCWPTETLLFANKTFFFFNQLAMLEVLPNAPTLFRQGNLLGRIFDQKQNTTILIQQRFYSTARLNVTTLLDEQNVGGQCWNV